MPEEPGSNLVSTEAPPKDEVAEKIAALDAKSKELDEQLAQYKTQNEGLASLNETLRSITTPQVAPAEPEPLPSDEEFGVDQAGSTARVAGRVMKEGMQAYHNTIAPELQELKQGLRSMELERLRRDPDNGKDFKRLEKDMNEVLDQYQNYTSGLAERVFFQIRGRKHNELREMDRTESLHEPVPPPTGGGVPARRGKEPEYDSLDETVVVHGVQKNMAAVARGLRVDEKDYFKHKYGRDMKTKEIENANG